MREVITTKYIADDGRVFDDKNDCQEHERVMYRMQAWENAEPDVLDQAKALVDTYEKAGEMTKRHMLMGIMAWEKWRVLTQGNASESPQYCEEKAMDEENKLYEQEQA